jgi:hypothetical protein
MENAMKYGIWCEVWGGATGHRQAWMKNKGRRMEFNSRLAAEAEATMVRKNVAENPHRTANFRYTVKEINDVHVPGLC